MRRISPGTPARAFRYVMPGGGRRLAAMSALAGLALVVGAAVVYLAGIRGVASPGAVAAHHANFEGRCSDCHAPVKGVADPRCERCHDPVDSRRLGTPAHAAIGGVASSIAAHTSQMDCAVCHGDHRGRGADLRRVADERCESCHDFRSFSRHPEFALVRSGQEADAGIDFSHETHLRDVEKTGVTGVERCYTCHTQTQDGTGYEPISFDTHCAKCHIKDGALTLNGTDLLTSGFTPMAALIPGTPQASMPPATAPDERGRVTLQRFTHRDPWVLAAAARLTRTLAGTAVMTARQQRNDRLASLTAFTQDVPIASLSDGDLSVWAASLQNDVAALDQQIAAGAAAQPNGAAGLDALASAIDPSLVPLATQAAAQPTAQDPNAGRGADAQQVDDRRKELTQLLDAIKARNPALASRADALAKRLADVKADPASANPDRSALAERIAAVDAELASLEAIAGPEVTAEVHAFDQALEARLAGAADPTARLVQRNQLLTLLDTMSARATPAVRARIGELRRAVLALDDATGAVLRDRRSEKARLLERINLERTLRAEGGPASIDAVANAERTNATRALQTLTARRGFDDMQSSTVPELGGARGQAALKGLLGACLSCHRLTADETGLRPVANVARTMMPAATFDHKPHVLQGKCDTCHTKIEGSKAAVDVNVPNVASCRTCHDGSQARNDCVSCHFYHPRSAADTVTRSSAGL